MGLLVKLYRSLLWLLFLLDTRVPLSTISRFPNLLYEPPKAQVKRHVDTKEAGIVKEVELPLEEAVQRGFTPVWTDHGGARLLGPGTRLPPPPLWALRAHLVTKGQWLLAIHRGNVSAPGARRASFWTCLCQTELDLC